MDIIIHLAYLYSYLYSCWRRERPFSQSCY